MSDWVCPFSNKVKYFHFLLWIIIVIIWFVVCLSFSFMPFYLFFPTFYYLPWLTHTLSVTMRCTFYSRNCLCEFQHFKTSHFPSVVINISRVKLFEWCYVMSKCCKCCFFTRTFKLEYCVCVCMYNVFFFAHKIIPLVDHGNSNMCLHLCDKAENICSIFFVYVCMYVHV